MEREVGEHQCARGGWRVKRRTEALAWVPGQRIMLGQKETWWDKGMSSVWPRKSPRMPEGPAGGTLQGAVWLCS